MVSLISITSISTIFSAFEITVDGVIMSAESISNLKLNHTLTKELYDKCSDAVVDLEKINPELKKTGRAVRLANCIAESIKLCQDYEKKWKIIKFFTSQSDLDDFYIQHLKLSLCLTEMVNSDYLTRDFEGGNKQDKLLKYQRKIISYQGKCIDTNISQPYLKKIDKYKNKICNL